MSVIYPLYVRALNPEQFTNVREIQQSLNLSVLKSFKQKWIFKAAQFLKIANIISYGTSELLKTHFYKFLLMTLTKKLNIFSFGKYLSLRK